ncbi:MAG: hypothetical protein ACK5NO_04495, partial [Demequina sp.]
FIYEGTDGDEVNEYCANLVPDQCGEVRQFQTDRYVLNSDEDIALYERIKADGLKGWPDMPNEDASIWDGWTFYIQTVAEECPPPDVCTNLDGDQTEVPEGWTEVDGYCSTTVYVCWEIQKKVNPSLFFGHSQRSAVWGLPTFPQNFVFQGDDKQEVIDHCLDIVPQCDTYLQYQVDRYLLDSTADIERLERIKANGLQGGGSGYNHDGPIYDGWHVYLQVAGDACPKVPVCVLGAHGILFISQVPAGTELGEGQYLPLDNGWCYDAKSGNTEVCHAEEDGTFTYVPTAWWTAYRTAANPTWTLGFPSSPHFGHEADIFGTVTVGDTVVIEGQNLEGTGQERLDNDCYVPVNVCWLDQQAEGGPAWVAKEIDVAALSDSDVLWTGFPQDCFSVQGEVDICHATGDDGDQYARLTVMWQAVWDSEAGENGDWVFQFTGHNSHDGDLFPPISGVEYGIPYAFAGAGPGIEIFTEEMWADFLKFDCMTPVEPTKAPTSTPLTCEDPEGSLTYSATVGTRHDGLLFYLQKVGDDGVPEVFGPFNAHDVVNISKDGLSPGTYRVWAGPAALDLTAATMSVADTSLVEVDPYEFYTHEFVITAAEEECADIEPTTVEAVCEAGVPLLNYNVVLNDPLGEVTPEQIRISFSRTIDGQEFTWSADPIAVEPGSTGPWTGTMYWPGYEENEAGEAIAFPGWELLADGTWESVGNDLLGWTRGGATITVQLNPTTEITGTAYPAATSACEPISDSVLGAPPLPTATPAVPVEGVATYAG